MKIATRSVVALSAGLLLGLSVPAFASSALDETMVSKTVTFRDLDISKADGAQALYGRIVSAARTVCRDEIYSFVRECRARAVDDAVHGVGSALLSSIHRSAVERVEEVVLR